MPTDHECQICEKTAGLRRQYRASEDGESQDIFGKQIKDICQTCIELETQEAAAELMPKYFPIESIAGTIQCGLDISNQKWVDWLTESLREGSVVILTEQVKDVIVKEERKRIVDWMKEEECQHFDTAKSRYRCPLCIGELIGDLREGL